MLPMPGREGRGKGSWKWKWKWSGRMAIPAQPSATVAEVAKSTLSHGNSE